MRKATIAAVTAIVLATGVALYFKRGAAPERGSGGQEAGEESSEAASVTEERSEKVRPRKKAREVLSQPVKALEDVSRLPEKFTAAPAVCQERWRDMASLSAMEMWSDLHAGLLIGDEACAGADRGLLENVPMAEEMKACMSFLSKGVLPPETAENKKMLEDCKSAALFFRAAVLDLLFPDEPVEDLPPAVLANKILLRLGNGMGAAEERAKLLALANELIRKEPNLYSGHKTRAVLMLFPRDGSGHLNPDSPEFLAALDTCREFGINDPELDEVAFMRHAIANRPERMDAEAQALLEQNPDSALAKYFLASSAFKAGRKDEALNLLRQAQALAPNDTRIAQTLELLPGAKPDDKIFRSKMSVSFDDELL